MDEFLCQAVCPIIQNYSKASKDINVYWRSRSVDREQAGVPRLQVLRYMSRISLRAGALTFYLVSVALLYFLEEWTRKHIEAGKTVTGYLPVRFDAGKNDESKECYTDKLNKIARVQLLHLLHQSADFVTKPRRSEELKMISIFTSDYFFCRVILSYVANILEAEDILTFNHRVSTFSSSQRCLLKKENVDLGRVRSVRTLSDANHMSERLNNGERKVDPIFNSRSMFSVLPVV